MAYADARSRIKTVLAALAITSPTALSVTTVYEDPPATITDRPPVFILYGSAGQYDYTLGGVAIAEEVETERCRLIMGDEQVKRAAEIARAFRAALLTAFKTESGLGGHGLIQRVVWEEVSGVIYGGKGYVAVDFLITFLVMAP